MLLFIIRLVWNLLVSSNFNTSHVTVYPSSASNPPPNNSFQYISCYCLSAIQMRRGLLADLFQYISCYCLSTCFTTCPRYLLRFQYISCYCLSLIIICGFFNLFVFQYISCYCLSIPTNLFAYRIFYFNTSHVTVYRVREQFKKRFNIFQYISCYCLSRTFLRIHSNC